MHHIQKQVFEGRKLTPQELKSALDVNFGYHVDAALHAARPKSSLNEHDVHEIVKYIVEQNCTLDLSAIKNEVYRHISASIPATSIY
ncbi:MAG: hypothetical protein ACSLEM_01955 [Candidatus Malihini olakiniferum]